MTRHDAHRPRSLWDRSGRYLATKGWAHLLLLTGVAIFLFPFLWMLGMTLKTDDEATTTDLFPTIPVFRGDSPAIRPPPTLTRPASVSAPSWKSLLPTLQQLTRSKLDKLPLPPGGDLVDADALRSSATQALIVEGVDQLGEKAWAQPADKLIADYQMLLTPGTVQAALSDHIGCLSFRSLQIRTLDAKITNIFSGVESASKWHVDSGNAQLLPGDGDAFLKYHFDSSSDPPIVLSTHFAFPSDPSQLHKVIVGLTGDDSWHRIDATLDVGGQRWISALTYYVAQYRPGSMIFQPPTFDDTTYQAKKFIPLEAAPHPSDLHQSARDAVLTLTIRPSSTARAIFGKVQRNYLRAFRSVPVWTYIGNSVLLVTMQVLGAIFSSAFVAYAFARLNWPGRSFAFGLLLCTMMLPGQVTMIPSFVIWKSLGWYNTLNPIWIGSWFGSAFFIFLMTQNMKTIPRELEEAARIDGLNSVQTWWYIILPLVKPTLAAIAIMVFQGAWNEFMQPLIMLRDQSKFPLSLGLFGLQLDNKFDFTLVMAGNMLMTLPVILIFFLFQRYFIEGVTVSGMKG